MKFTVETELNIGDRVNTLDGDPEVGTVRYITFDDQTGEGDEKYAVEYTVRWTSTYQGKPIETKHSANELKKLD